MKSKFSLKEMRAARKRKPYIIALSVLFVLLVTGLLFRNTLLNDKKLKADLHFRGCDILAENCTDVVSCGLNVYCGDGRFNDCRVYDCGNSYGIFTEDVEGKIEFKNDTKADANIENSIRDSCTGKMEILSSACVGQKTEIKVKLTTKGKCEIEEFSIVDKNVGSVPNTFIIEEDGTYSITAGICVEIAEIIPAAKGGIGIDLAQEGA